MNRDRKFAVYDKQKSLKNYLKLDDDDELKGSAIRRLTGADHIDYNKITQFLKDNSNQEEEGVNNLPKPPSFSGIPKIFLHQDNEMNIFIHERGAVINNFDHFETLAQDLSLINLENYLSKFEEDELDSLRIKDILTFDLKEFDQIKAKLEEFIQIAEKLNDQEIKDFLKAKIKNVEMNRSHIDLLVENLEKVDDFIILNETLKFFFKKTKK
jgi:hypothetical protein